MNIDLLNTPILKGFLMSKQNSLALDRKRNITTERPPLSAK
jgi:hypothetical protein